MKIVAETAWHHEGDYQWFEQLIDELIEEPSIDFIKIHMTLELDAYMHPSHPSYEMLKQMMFSRDQWVTILQKIKRSEKGLFALLNDVESARLCAEFSPEVVELHSVCLNVPILQSEIAKVFDSNTKIAIGVSGSALEEISAAIQTFDSRDVILMFGFQNYPTDYNAINLKKIRRIQNTFPQVQYGYADHTAWNEENNLLVTALVASNSMEYVEKHVTISEGSERVDYEAAISLGAIRELRETLNLVDAIQGSGALTLSPAEKKYSQPGLMKMVPVAASNLLAGHRLKVDDIKFLRTNETSDIGQSEVSLFINAQLAESISAGSALTKQLFET